MWVIPRLEQLMWIRKTIKSLYKSSLNRRSQKHTCKSSISNPRLHALRPRAFQADDIWPGGKWTRHRRRPGGETNLQSIGYRKIWTPPHGWGKRSGCRNPWSARANRGAWARRWAPTLQSGPPMSSARAPTPLIGLPLCSLACSLARRPLTPALPQHTLPAPEYLEMRNAKCAMRKASFVFSARGRIHSWSVVGEDKLSVLGLVLKPEVAKPKAKCAPFRK